MHFSLETGFRAPKNQGGILFCITSLYWCLVYPNRKKKNKFKLLGSVAASEAPFGVQLAEPGSQGRAAEVLQVMVHCWQWSRPCWEHQGLTSTEGSNPSCASKGG